MFKAHTESRPISQDRLEPATTAIGMVLAHGLAAGPLNEARMLLLQACQGADRRLVTPICTMIEARLLTSICSPRSGHTPLATARMAIRTLHEDFGFDAEVSTRVAAAALLACGAGSDTVLALLDASVLEDTSAPPEPGTDRQSP